MPFNTSTIPRRLILSSILILPCSCAYISATSNGREASLFNFILSGINLIKPFVSVIVGIWLLLEIAFYFYFIKTRTRLQQTTKPKKPLCQSERTSLFWNCVQTIDKLDTWAEGWFYYKKSHLHPKFEEIHRENLALWFAWAFWHEHLDIVRQNKEWADEIEWMLASAEKWFQVDFPAGLNSELECIRLNLDPVEAVHRPLIVYVGLYMITMIFNTFVLQWLWGFTHSDPTAPGIEWGGPLALLNDGIDYLKTYLFSSVSHQEDEQDLPRLRSMSYWYRAPSETSTTATPLVFIHGIGAGVVFYAEFVHQLALFDRPLFVIELPYVAMHMVDRVPSAAETVDEIKEMLHTFGYEKAVFVSHSLGTGVSSWVLNMAPETVAGMVMVDPICFLLHYHNVAFNFVHRLPKTLFEYVLYYGASKELYISNYISRHFQWFETIYFVQPSDSEEMPMLPSTLEGNSPLVNASVFLSEMDGIVGSATVARYLEKRGVDSYLMNGMEHAMFLANSSWKRTITKRIDLVAQKADFELNK